MAAYPEQRREGILLKSPFQKRKSFNARQRLLAKALDIMQREPPSATWSLASSILVMPMAIFAVFPTAEQRSEEHTSELQSLMRISYAVFCLKTKNINTLKILHTLPHTTTHNKINL